MMAMKVGLESCVDRKDVADGGRADVEKEPGTMRMSNCGASSNEFWIRS